GASSQRPCSGVPSSAAKHAAASKRGRQSQSMEPSTPTRAAVRMFPMMAYCSMFNGTWRLSASRGSRECDAMGYEHERVLGLIPDPDRGLERSAPRPDSVLITCKNRGERFAAFDPVARLHTNHKTDSRVHDVIRAAA